jgi:(E)-4-hydroxy-3-methylbut-2-enyl-diphosphate synthase
MTTSNTEDIVATLRQCIELAEVGCEIIRVTAPNVPAALCLREIRAQFSASGFADIPLVADIHFLPQAAMTAVEFVEKIRINPGNYADKKKFAVRDYTDADYGLELERLHEAAAPLVKRCKELGRSLRIGTNHGSLSDRILNRYGDTPLGMVESALEFVRICENQGFHDLILSMKASNPKVVIQAYRLLVSRMDAAHRPYPLHLGVTEAGDGEDGRIKSAIGIGSLLFDGIGDTIRVSLTEDSVFEIPVARALADKAMRIWARVPEGSLPEDAIKPFSYSRRDTASCTLGISTPVSSRHPPRVIAPAGPLERVSEFLLRHTSTSDTPVEGLMLQAGLPHPATLPKATALIVDLGEATPAPALLEHHAAFLPAGSMILVRPGPVDGSLVAACAKVVRAKGLLLAMDLAPGTCTALAPILSAIGPEALVATLSRPGRHPAIGHALGAYRHLAEELRLAALPLPIWIRCTPANGSSSLGDELGRLLDASILAGGLLCDGIGDLISVESDCSPEESTRLAYNVLQGAGARIFKTEYVACPSCGRTLFDLQSTTQRIRSMTSHLKGLKIAIMGCIVNGPGEMADADFGYVGGAPGKINLYVGKECVQYNIPQEEADARLIALIKSQGRWLDPIQPEAAIS